MEDEYERVAKQFDPELRLYSKELLNIASNFESNDDGTLLDYSFEDKETGFTVDIKVRPTEA